MTERLSVRLVTGNDHPSGDPETQFLADVLRECGWRVDIAIWSDPTVAWGSAPLTILRSPWDYPDHLQAFLEWTDRTATETTLLNRPSLVRSNVDKRYLIDLAARGIEVVPSVWVEHLEADRIGEVRRHTGWSDLVAKPTVGCDGVGVVRMQPGEGVPRGLPASPEGWLLQPFVPSVHIEGERSVVVIDGDPVYATLKRPPGRGSEFRVQERWGGTCAPVALLAGEADRARGAIEVVGGGSAPLYARVDYLHWAGAWRVAEIELIEPSLYFLGDPKRVEPLERALRRRATPS